MAFFGKKRYSTVQVRKRDIPGGLWKKCRGCSEIIYREEIDRAVGICPRCGFHFPVSRAERLALLADDGSFEEWDADLLSVNPLGFQGPGDYAEKLEQNRRKTGFDEAVSCGSARMDGIDVGLAVMDFNFMGASMGSVVGERITRAVERCTDSGRPVIICCASGGARMYEGMLSLMQMAKTSAALARHSEASLPYIAILTHPTTAGVMASFATLGDVILAEPGALIGFAGPRVIRETTGESLKEGFQRSEFLLEHGLLDDVVPRPELKGRVVHLLRLFLNLPPAGEE